MPFSVKRNRVSKDATHDIWKKACKHLSDVLHEDIYSRWIAIIEPLSLEDGTLTLSVDNDFYQTWLEENYLSLIESALGTVHGEPLKTVFAVQSRGAAAAEEAPVKAKPSLTDRFLGRKQEKPALNAKFNFDSFIVGSSNQFAHAASMAVAQAPGTSYNPLFIYGDVGLGKTHLMQAIGHHALTSSRATVRYLSSETMMNEYIDALTHKSLPQFRKKYRNADLLLIDDIHFLAGKERLQEEFFHTFNALFDMRKQIIMTSDRPASEISGLEKRLVSRFEWGLVVELESPDLETRIAILRDKQKGYNLQLDDELLHFIAANIRSNIRKLEGALIRAVSYSSLTGKHLDLGTLKTLLRDVLEAEQTTAVTFDGIQRAVAEFYDVRLADMSSKRRPRNIAVPRQIAMYLCRRLTSSSLPDIAGSFSKTHATVLYAYNTIDSRLDIDPKLRQDVDQIAQKLGKPLV